MFATIVQVWVDREAWLCAAPGRDRIVQGPGLGHLRNLILPSCVAFATLRLIGKARSMPWRLGGAPLCCQCWCRVVVVRDGVRHHFVCHLLRLLALVGRGRPPCRARDGQDPCPIEVMGLHYEPLEFPFPARAVILSRGARRTLVHRPPCGHRRTLVAAGEQKVLTLWRTAECSKREGVCGRTRRRPAKQEASRHGRA